MTKIAIITGSTRSSRRNHGVAKWVLNLAQQRTDADFELVDIADFQLPLMGEPQPEDKQAEFEERLGAWGAKVGEFDGFVLVTAEYNHSVTPALANALAYLNPEWNNKAAGIVGYGSVFGVRAVEHLRGILSELQVAHVQKQGLFSLFTDFDGDGNFDPTELQAASVPPMLDQVVTWAKALETVREA